MLAVKLLQTPGVWLDGDPVAFPFKRAEALLYYMLIRRSATRQELISLLWESCDETTGLKNLRNAIYTLKKALGGDVLVSPQRSVVMVNEEWEIDCDYDRFVRQGDFSAYHGPFLQGFSVKHAFTYEEWLGRTRDKLHERYLSGLAQRAEQAGQAGETGRARTYAAEYLREDPYNENMAAFLMNLYRQDGQYPAAAQVYQRLKEQLDAELGAAPLERTTVLYYELMNEWNDTSASAEQEPEEPAPVGREAAYAVLRAAAASFRERTRRYCSQLFTGEVGSGKSALVRHFLRRAETQDFLILREDCLPSEHERPLAPWRRMLSAAVRQPGVSGRLSEQLERYFAGSERDPAPARAGEALRELVLRLMAELAQQKQVMIFLEDVQWCDGESLRLLDAVLRGVQSGTVMAVLTRRDNSPARTAAQISQWLADGLIHEHRLHPLTREETFAFLRRELGEETAASLSGQFYEETGGNLYLLAELTQAYRRSGSVKDVISSVRDILLHRITGLGEDAVWTARLISMFPQAAPCSVLSALAGREGGRLAAGAEELSRRGLIFEEEYDRAAAYRFAHQRIRELVYAQQSYFQRRETHLRIARLCSDAAAAPESEGWRDIAWHYRMGQEPVSALEYAVRALEMDSEQFCEPFPILASPGGREKNIHALYEELEQAQRDLAALRREGMDAAVFGSLNRRLTLIRGRLTLFQGKVAEGSDILGALSGDADPKRDGELMMKACCLLACYALSTQSAPLAERYVATGMRLAERRGDPVRIAMLERLRGNCFCLRGEYDKSVYYLLQAIEELEKRSGEGNCRLQLAGAYYDYGRVCRQRLDYAGACSYYKKALALVGEGERCPGVVWIYVHYGRAAFAMEDHPRADVLFHRGYELGLERGEPYGLAAAAAYTAWYEVRSDRFDLAARALSKARELSAQLSAPLERGIVCFVSMRLRADLDACRWSDEGLARLLSEPADSYARQGVRALSSIPDVFEVGLMSRGLKEGISQKRSFRARELYSTNRNFMAE